MVMMESTIQLKVPNSISKNGYYYIFAPAGGVTTGWQLVLRSQDIYGPYEKKIVMAQGSTNINGPHQGAWVDTQTEESWFVHFQDKAMYAACRSSEPDEVGKRLACNWRR